MEESFLRTHRDFITNLKASLDVIGKDITEAREMQSLYAQYKGAAKTA